MNMRPIHFIITLVCLIFFSPSVKSQEVVLDVDWQPFIAQSKRVIEAMDYLGIPVDAKLREAIKDSSIDNELQSIREIQELFDKYCIASVNINPESRVKVSEGKAKPILVKNGWRQFLVKIHNEAGVTAPLKATSPNAGRLAGTPAHQIAMQWLDLQMFDSQPMKKTLSGLEVEYRIIQLYSRDAGKREARIGFNVGQGTQDIGFRNEVDILFQAEKATPVTLRVLDEHGKAAAGAFEIRDQLGRVYPSQAKRLAPDFAFHPQIYRYDKEVIQLPAGEYKFHFSRGPESLPEIRNITIGIEPAEVAFKVKRWIDPALTGWWSGDHHIHAAGCSHYTNPSEGVHAPDMIRHCFGEDLKIGANLTWGPCFDYQKQFFTGDIDKVSRFPYLLRYDIEISGFGSHRSGHLCLLRLKDQMYPGGNSKDHWPTLCLNSLKWAKAQGAVTGPAHSGWGLQVETDELPNYIIPPFNGIGANEYIVDVTHEVVGATGQLEPAVDFISTVDTPYVWELNIWYHTLNAGFRTRISGETDFPCIYGERVGLGRSYVKLDGPLNYDDWCQGIKKGRNYVGDGRSHFLHFDVNGLEMGTQNSEIKLNSPSLININSQVAALLNETPNPSLRDRPYHHKPFWHIERARHHNSRKVPVELIVNGEVAAMTYLEADGQLRDLSWQIPIEKSSWVALRVLPSSHTNPIFVIVDEKPIRASRKSIQWCLESVDQCWSQKKNVIAQDEMSEAIAAYDHARKVYSQRLNEVGKSH